MKKKNICLIFVVILLIIMLIPIPGKLKDGGSIEYNAILYSVTKYHKINPESTKGYDDGWKIKIVGLTVYDKTNTYVDIEKNKEDKKEDEISDVVMTIKEGTLSKEGVTVVLKNNIDKDYTYGPDFYVEKYDDGSWKQVSTLTGDPLSWNAIAYPLKANDSVELTLNFKSTYGELSEGKYRVIKRISKDEDTPITEDKVIKLSVEFEIE